jgi:hypothetical protein
MKMSNALIFLNKEELKELAALYDELYKKAKFLVSLGISLKPSRDFERVLKKARQDIENSLLKISGMVPSKPDMTEEEKIKAIETAKKYAIRSIWLSGKFKEDKE